MLATSLPSHLSPIWTVALLFISWPTEEQNPRLYGEHRANRGILEGLESLYHRVTDPIFESEVFVALIWLWAGLGGKV
jgi:hypothetical protein